MQPQLDYNFLLFDIFTTVGQIFDMASVSDGFASVLPHVDQGVIEFLKILSLFLTIILLLGIVIVLLKVTALRKPKDSIIVGAPPEPAPEGPWAARWGEVTRHMDSAKEAEWKFAIIEADALVDRVLAKSGFAGATLGERLLNIQPTQLVTLEQLWAAHKVRNRVAHQPDYFLKYSEAKQAIHWFEEALHELAAL